MSITLNPKPLTLNPKPNPSFRLMLRKRVRAASSIRNAKASKKAKSMQIAKLGAKNVISRGRSLKAKLTYFDTVFLDPGLAGTLAVHTFAANGVYDPDITGVGHQPVGFDEYIALYKRYVVTNSWIKVSFINTGTTDRLCVGIIPSENTPIGNDPRRYIEQGTAQWTQIGDVAGGAPKAQLTHFMNMRQMSGKDIFGEDDFEGNASGNPSNTQYWNVFAVGLDSAANPTGVWASVEIQYEVYFRDPEFTNIS